MARLPYNIFFEPTDKFVEFLMTADRYRYKRFVDVGAGVGQLGQALHQAGLDVHCFDIHERPDCLHHVDTDDARDFPYRFSDCAIWARPCHSPELMKGMEYAIDAEATVLYVGLPKNVEGDLDGYVYDLLMDNAGQEGECVWRVYGCQRQLDDWVLLETTFWSKLEWMIDGGRRWKNVAGGGFPKEDNIKELRRERRAWATQLDHDWGLVQDVVDPETGQSQGWITPEGKWVGCRYEDHVEVLRCVYNIDEARAETTGWVRVYGRSWRTGASAFWVRSDGKRVTPKQKKQLDLHGFAGDDREMIRS